MGRWLTVALEAQGSEAVEVELEDDEALLLTNLQSQFTKAKGLRYRNEENGALRAVKCADGKLQAPDGGWGSRTYLVVEAEPEDSAAATEAAAAVAESTAASALAEDTATAQSAPTSTKRRYEHGDYPPEEDRKRSRAEQPCYRCGGNGHIAHMCTSPWDSKDNTDAQECYLCKGRGHMKHQCPNNLPKGVCYKCGQYGHQGRECPQGRGPMPGGAMPGGVQNGGVIGGDYASTAAAMANYGYGYAYDPAMYAAAAQQYAAAAGAGGYGTSTPGYSSGYGGQQGGGGGQYGSRGPKLCYRCQQPGHNALACPQLQEAGVPVDSCFKCGLQGHRAKDCNVCVSCKQPGHIASMCPMRA